MDWDDLNPQKQPARKKNLDPLSIDELEDYIRDLEAEIERVRGEIAKKSMHKSGAEKFFKS